MCIRDSHIRSEVVKNILSFALPFLPAGIFTMIMELSNRYMLEWFEGTHAVGLFSAGYKLGIFGLIIVMGFNMGWTPYFLKRVKEKDAKILDMTPEEGAKMIISGGMVSSSDNSDKNIKK